MPYGLSARQNRAFAVELIEFLRGRGEMPEGQQPWTEHNLKILREFVHKHGALVFPSPPPSKRNEFMWDFVAYVQQRGMMLVARSEHHFNESSLTQSFERLFYVRSPIKLLICRVTGPERANEICTVLQRFCKTRALFYPGEVFIIYCPMWADTGKNRDLAFLMQVRGEPVQHKLRSERFEPVESGSVD